MKAVRYLSNITNMSLAKKLGAGFFGITAILICIVILNTSQIRDNSEISDRVSEVRVPTAMASIEMLNGINHALAALRGWMLLGNEAFVDERQTAWEEEIHSAYATMEELSQNWTNPRNIELLEEIGSILPEFQRFQDEIEAIAQTDENVPAVEMLLSEAAPQADIIVANITRMIDLEGELPATPERKALLGMMADVRGSMGLALANIRAFLLSGDPQFREAYERYWATNERRFTDLSNNQDLFSEEQEIAFAEMNSAREIFAPLPPLMLESRGAEDWNLANYWLATRAAPLGARLGEILGEMSADQETLLNADASLIQEKSNATIQLSWIMLAAGVLLAALVGFFITRYLVRQITKVMGIAESIAQGSLSNKIEVDSSDETGRLLAAMDSMQTNLSNVIEREIQSLVDAANEGDLSQRINLDSKEGFYHKLSASINDLVDVNEHIIDDTINVVSAMANGDLSKSIDNDYQGSFGRLKTDVISMQKKLSQVIEVDVQSIVDAASNGDLSERISLEGKDGFYGKLANSINELVDVNDSVIKDTIRVVSAMDKGDLTETISADYRGSFGRLKENVASMQSKLAKVIEQDIHAIVKAANEGDLKQRIDLGDKKGFYKELSSSINELVNTSDEIISDTSMVISAMANGDLTKKIESRYLGSFNELKTNINNTIDKLIATVTEIKSSASAVRTGSEEISIGSTNLSQRTEEQAGSLEETSSAMEEITSTVQSNSGSCAEAKQLARGAREVAENGGSVVGRAVVAMEAINDSSQEIANIISVIDEISFQTNLLALNASVEAARAGEQGRGFAVVANEVRSLAERCAEAASKVQHIIKNSNDRVKEGSELVNKSGDILQEIVTSVQKVNNIVTDISDASEEQTRGLEEISRAVMEMDQMTQQNAALVEETAAACESLGGQSKGLDELIAFFNVGVTDISSRSRDSDRKTGKLELVENTAAAS